MSKDDPFNIRPRLEALIREREKEAKRRSKKPQRKKTVRRPTRSLLDDPEFVRRLRIVSNRLEKHLREQFKKEK